MWKWFWIVLAILFLIVTVASTIETGTLDNLNLLWMVVCLHKFDVEVLKERMLK